MILPMELINKPVLISPPGPLPVYRLLFCCSLPLISDKKMTEAYLVFKKTRVNPIALLVSMC